MDNAWLKADLETAQMVLSRIEHEDIPKLKRLLERIATIRGVEVEDKPTPRWPSTAPTQEMIDDRAGFDIDERMRQLQHPGESVQTWHEDRGPEWPEEEE